MRLCGWNQCNRTATYFPSWFAFDISVLWEQIDATVAPTNNSFHISFPDHSPSSVCGSLYTICVNVLSGRPSDIQRSMAAQSRFQRPVSRDQTQVFQTSGTRYQIPDTRYQTPDTRHQIPKTRHQSKKNHPEIQNKISEKSIKNTRKSKKNCQKYQKKIT